MTTDPTPDWEQLLVKLDRVIEVLEDIRDARRGQTTQRPPTPEEVRAFARGGRVKPPEGGIVVTFDPTHGPSQQEIADATMLALRRQGRLK